jgi:hypothetical protein
MTVKVLARAAFLAISLGVCCGVAATGNHLLLSLDFSDSTALGKQTDTSLPTLNRISDVAPAKPTGGAVDFGTRGMLQGPMLRPEGAFTIETRFLLRAYAAESPYLSDLMSTGNWEGYPQQGLALSIGGGDFYPLLPKNAYSQEDLYPQSLDLTGGQKASLSRCVVRFVFATLPGGTAQWLEAFTDRCVEPGKWTHVVAVWDGHAAHLYLNGKEATDIWRLNGPGSQPMLDSLSTVNVGARYHLLYDQRHLDGMMDYVRVVDTAMSEAEIHKRYGETLPPESPESSCRGSILPKSPAAGALCDEHSSFELKLDSYGACQKEFQAWQLSPGDSIEVEFSRKPDFLDPFLRVTVPDTSFRLDGILAALGDVFSKDPCYWRVRLQPKVGGLAKSGALAAPEVWSSPKPFYFSHAGTSVRRWIERPAAGPKLRPVAGGILLTGWNGDAAPAVFGLDGRAAPVSITRITDGAWMIAAPKTGAGAARLYLLKTFTGIIPILLGTR